MEFPPIPSWNALHPIIVHVPIGFLLAVPVLLLVGVALGARGRCWQLAALVVMTLGTAATYVAVESGEAASRLVTRTGAVSPVLDHHEELGEATRLVFTLLTVLWGALLLGLGRIRKGSSPAPLRTVHFVFLGLYLSACLVLANAGHAGGRLVHEFGLRAPISSSVTAVAPPGR